MLGSGTISVKNFKNNRLLYFFKYNQFKQISKIAICICNHILQYKLIILSAPHQSGRKCCIYNIFITLSFGLLLKLYFIEISSPLLLPTPFGIFF